MNKVIPLLTFSILLLIPVSQDAFANHIRCDLTVNLPHPGVDYSNCDLTNSGGIFSNENLFDAFFIRADLTGADLSGANLRSADFTDADLTGADLFGASLTGARLIGADLTGANLFGADLTGAELFGADLTGANLFGADLSFADFSDANLPDADLTGANLFGADLTGADLTNANLNCLNHPICLSDNEPPLTCGPNTFESGGECIPIAELVFCGEHTEEILGFCVPILAELCSTGTMIDMGVCTAQAMGSMIGGWLLDIDTTALLVASIGTNPVITTLMGITIAGVAGQAVWFVHRRKSRK